jgi:anti-sigma factor (TIGR02949 family)
VSGGAIPPLPPECLEVLHHIWDYLDGQLTDEATERLSDHLAACQQCFEFKTFQENFLAALAALRDRSDASPALRERVIESLRAERLGR